MGPLKYFEIDYSEVKGVVVGRRLVTMANSGYLCSFGKYANYYN